MTEVQKHIESRSNKAGVPSVETTDGRRVNLSGPEYLFSQMGPELTDLLIMRSLVRRNSQVN